MEKRTGMKVAGAASVGTALVALGALQVGAIAAPAAPAEAAGGPAPVVAVEATTVGSPVVEQNEVAGMFAFTQNAVSSNEWLAKHVGSESSKYLCGSQVVATGEADDPASWTLTVSGDVAQPLEATIGELAESPEVQTTVMGCACGGNPADGLSVANALVKGLPVTTLVAMAEPGADANTVVFVSSDGYEMALPLSYLESHYCPLVFNVNGSALVESVGGTNQLWLGSTPASYFVRDVVGIRVEVRDEAPASPTSDEARAAFESLPNIGVLFGGEVA